MKPAIRIICLLIIPLYSLTQPVLHWRFSNPVVTEDAGESWLQFDVEVACSMENTYQSSMMVFFSYNPAVFGETLNRSGRIQCEKLNLLDLQLQGTDGYSLVLADYSPTVFALTTEAAFMAAGDQFLEKIPLYPDFAGFARFRLKIADPKLPAGIAFVPDSGPEKFTGLMDKNQFYFDPDTKSEVLYGKPEKYEAVYENGLKDIIPMNMK